MTVLGISTAMQPIAAYNIGSKNYDRLKTIVVRTILYSALFSTILWGFSMFFASHLIRLFLDDINIIDETTQAFKIMTAVFPVISIYYISIAYYQAKGNAKVSVILSTIRRLILMVPIAFILSKGFNMGAKGVWLSYHISDLLSGILSFILIKGEMNKKH